MELKGVKKWYQSLGVKSGLGLLAFALGLMGIGITNDQLQYLYSAIPAMITSGFILYRRITQYTKGIGVAGTVALIFGVIAGGIQALPPEVASEYAKFHDYFIGVSQIILTLLGAYGIHRADKKVVFKEG